MMNDSISMWRRYWKTYSILAIIVLLGTLTFLILRHRGTNPMENTLVIKGKVFELIEVTSRKTIARIRVTESSVNQYDVRDKEDSWCCVVKDTLAEIPMFPYYVKVGDSLEYGPKNRVRLFRSGEKIYDEKLGTSPLGGVFEKVREKHRL